MKKSKKRRKQKRSAKADNKENLRQPPQTRGQVADSVPADDLQGLIQEGARLHQAGQLREAEAIYRQILEISPSHADANLLMG